MVVSCSCFAPTPSMAAMLVNHFKLRRDVLTYNLSGMGCSSSLISVDLVKHLLKVSSCLSLFFSACMMSFCVRRTRSRVWVACNMQRCCYRGVCMHACCHTFFMIATPEMWGTASWETG